MCVVVEEYVFTKSKLIEAVLRKVYEELRVWRMRGIYVSCAQKNQVFGVDLMREMLYLRFVAWVFDQHSVLCI